MSLSATNLVIFQVGPVPCGVDSNSVLTVIEPPSHITAIPGSNAFRPGLFSYSHKPVAVYDVRTKFNLPTDQRGKIIISEMNQQFFGFWVDCIQEIIGAEKGKWQILPAECPKDLFESLFILKDQLVFKTNFEALAKAQVSTQTQRFIAKLVSETNQKTSTEDSKHTHELKKTKPEITSEKNTHFRTDESPASSEIKTSIKTRKSSSQPVFKTNTKTSLIPPKSKKENSTPVTIQKTENLKTNQSVPVSNIKTKIPSPGKAETTRSIIQQREQKKIIQSVSAIATTKHESSPHKSTTSSNTQRIQNQTKEEVNSSGVPVLIFLLLIIGLFGGGLYWLLLDDPAPKTRTQVTKNFSKQKIPEKTQTFTSDPEQEKENYVSESTTEPPVTSTSVFTEPVFNTALTDTSDDATENPTVGSTQDYSANIQQADDTIVITLSGNDSQLNNEKESLVDNQLSENDIQEIETDKEAIESSPVSKDTEEVLEISIQTKKANTSENKTSKATETITEVIHIVVKGDTLWHIAKRYIHDPFKYNELARLSRIKNPDLIYPGNKVIIRIINGNK